MPNRLRDSASPYLRQHAENPVDWYEWGPEALARARAEQRPILLSIGYAACHWCHVMAHESFEDAPTAALMNERFVNIKVDREERPDLDAIYMQAVQALTGHGGWPMTVFLTPDGAPFHGGTYFPPDDRHGLPSFRRVLLAVANAWRDKRGDVESAGQALTDHLRKASIPAEPGLVDRATLERAFRSLARDFDARHGGFGGAPKFPPCMALDFLLRHWARTRDPLALEIVTATYSAILRGGIHDQVGGGIHRYSVDERWLVPHFEKMLYDNALFARLGVRIWQATRDPGAREGAERALDWVIREMTDDGGAFHSSLDADSEGEEGRFYVWTREEVAAAAGPDAEVALAHWGVTDEGNFEGRNILFVPHGQLATAARFGATEADTSEALGRARRALYAARARRTWPGRDAKVVASWNGLMIRAFAEASRAFQRPDYLDAATAAGHFLAAQMVRDGRASRSALGGRASGPGVLEDYGALGLAFLDLYGTTFDPSWLDRAMSLAQSAVALFRDPATGTWYDTANDAEPLIVRPRDFTDNATPSGMSLVAELLLSLADIDDRPTWRGLAESIVRAGGEALERYPLALGHLAGVADTIVNGGTQLALVGQPESLQFRELAGRVGSLFVPGLVVAGGTVGASGPALLRGRPGPAGGMAWVCQGSTCGLPTTDPNELARQLAGRLEVGEGGLSSASAGRPVG